MAKDYSMDLRQRVMVDGDGGMGTKAVADKYRVNPAWVRRFKQHRRERGDLRTQRDGYRPRSFDRDRLAALVAQQPDAPLAELRQKLGVKVALLTLCTALKQLKLT